MGRRRTNTPEKLKKYKADYFQRNKERLQKKCRQWTAKNPERNKLIKERWRLKNLEKIKSGIKSRKQKNPEIFKAYSQKYEAKNLEKVKAAKEKWRIENREYMRRYLELNPEKFRAASLRRRSSKISNSTPEQIDEANKKVLFMLESEFTECPYCEITFETSKMDVEHIFPLSRGGSHSAKNIMMACSRCNGSKGNKLLYFEWTPPCGIIFLNHGAKK